MQTMIQALQNTLNNIEKYVVGQSSLLRLDESDKDSIYIIKCKIWDAVERLKRGGSNE